MGGGGGDRVDRRIYSLLEVTFGNSGSMVRKIWKLSLDDKNYPAVEQKHYEIFGSKVQIVEKIPMQGLELGRKFSITRVIDSRKYTINRG